MPPFVQHRIIVVEMVVLEHIQQQPGLFIAQSEVYRLAFYVTIVQKQGDARQEQEAHNSIVNVTAVCILVVTEQRIITVSPPFLLKEKQVR